MKTNGFNLQEQNDRDINLTLNVNKNIGEKPRRKRKINFDKLFPAPKNNRNMGMDTFYGNSMFTEEFF